MNIINLAIDLPSEEAIVYPILIVSGELLHILWATVH